VLLEKELQGVIKLIAKENDAFCAGEEFPAGRARRAGSFVRYPFLPQASEPAL